MSLLNKMLGKLGAKPTALMGQDSAQNVDGRRGLEANAATPAKAQPARQMPVNAAVNPGSRVESLPGSDLRVLASIGESVRARLATLAAVGKVPSTQVEMYFARGFLTPGECSELIRLIDADVKPSGLVAEGVGREHRTSETCRLPAEQPIVAAIEDRIARLLGQPLSHSQPIQGQRYTVGQQFKLHSDYFAAGYGYSTQVAAEGGQRTWTAMAFLDEPEEGGCTNFPKIGMKIRPRAGTLLIWNNLDRQGRPNRDSRHEGMVVEKGVKHVLTKWFREREWKPGAPAA